MKAALAICAALAWLIPAVASVDAPSPDAPTTDDSTIVHFTFDSQKSLAEPLTNDGARWQPGSPGKLSAPADRDNRGSLEFDGKSAIVQAKLGELTEQLQSGFTWEGFFLSSPANTYETDGAIADRFVTQFIKGNAGSTRLTVGLAAAEKGELPVLCIALAGTSNLHRGRFPVAPGVWHHFAVVHSGEGDAARLAWYLDYELEGEVTLDGSSGRTTLKPSGQEPLAIGARLKQGEQVNRGFQGRLDEIRLSSRSLEPDEFLHAGKVGQAASFERGIAAGLYEDLPESFDWNFADLKPRETVPLEALTFSMLPQKFSQRGYQIQRQGRQAIRAEQRLTLPAGEVRLLLRTATNALLTVDGRPLIDARVAVENHPLDALPAGPRDYVATFAADGQPHTFALATAYRAGPKSKLGEVVVCLSTGGGDWTYLGHPADLRVSPVSLAQLGARTLRAFEALEPERRQAAIRRGNQVWEKRHAAARRIAAGWNVPRPDGDGNPIDHFINRRLGQLGEKAAPLTGDAAFARRLSLDLRGRIPTVEELAAFLADGSPDKRARLIESMLAADEWADSWVGYWQDVLAENPDILKPTLNNSGPFRRWIYESFRRNLSMDRFATELILMEGGNQQGGTAGFAVASLNDAPMAMKAHVVMQAFSAVDLQCARCHDSPVSPFTQRDLFSLAALLKERPIKIPATSIVPPVLPGGRKPAVTVTLKAGQSIEPVWTLDGLIDVSAEPLSSADALRPRAELAATITSPHSRRFSDVLVNRTWKRYMGTGLIEPVDNWSSADNASHPDLLRYLSWSFVDSGYDMKQLVRLIVGSQAYQRRVSAPAAGGGSRQRTYAGQFRRRMTSEQIVDSLHVAVGRDFGAEELTFDPNRTRGFLNLGVPHRSWQMAPMSNERDRPALAMPVNQSIVDVLKTFGWRARRPNPITVRDHEPNPLQPLMMANSMLSAHLVRLTEESAITEMCLEQGTVEELADKLFLATLSRKPHDEERSIIVELLRPEFDSRLTGKPKPKIVKKERARVDWDKHLSPEATVELLEAQRIVREGPPATVRLTPEFRKRAEDALWCLFNSPEFVFVP